MKLFLFDLETTGLNHQKDKILEFGFIYWDTDYKKPAVFGSQHWFNEDYPSAWPEAEKVNGISYEFVKKFGIDPKKAINAVELFIYSQEVDYLVGHNAKSFDLPFLKAQIEVLGLDCPAILKTPLLDTRYDLPFNPAPKSRHLGHLAYDYGITHDVNEKHSALFDCQLMLGLLKKFDINTIVKNSKSPDVVVRANVTRENKDLAKFNGYSWNPERVAWLRTIKEYELNTEKERCSKLGFDISVC